VTHPPLGGVYETVLYGDDLQPLAGFYSDVLGLRLVGPVDEIAAAFRLPDGAMLLLFDARRSALPGRAVPSHGQQGAGHVAFSVPVESFDAWRDALTAAGVEIEQEVEWGGGARSIYVRDPAGNSVELAAGELWLP
jgi:catechol 2,3-dioxygenase-like lactoylglutathione lyase family enzyme